METTAEQLGVPAQSSHGEQSYLLTTREYGSNSSGSRHETTETSPPRCCYCLSPGNSNCKIAGLVVAYIILLSLSSIGYITLKRETDATVSLLHIEMDQMNQRISALQIQSNERFSLLNANQDGITRQETEFEVSTAGKFDVITALTSDLSDALSITNSTLNTQFGHISEIIKIHNAMLDRLANGTSNADVLDKLKATEEDMTIQLRSTKEQVWSSLSLAARNMSSQLSSAQREMSLALLTTSRNVSHSLALSSQQLAEAKAKVDETMDRTVSKMNAVVGEADHHIQAVQNNVTMKIDSISSQLDSTVTNLQNAVAEAEMTIKTEVNAVRDNIAQYVAVTNKQFASENDFVKYQLAGTFTILGCLISLFHLTDHHRHYHKPKVQNRVMAVLWMVPIYGITSWLSLVFPALEWLFGFLRDAYEAYVVYTFFGLLIAVLEDGQGHEHLVERLAAHVEEEHQALDKSGVSEGLEVKMHIVPPCCCCYSNDNPISVAAAWLNQCQLMAMQFVVMKPLLTIIPILSLYGFGYDFKSVPVLTHGPFFLNFHSPRLYILIAQNVSVALAFYGLMCFYHGTEKELEWCNPWPKFLCIKGVVFATFWQSVAITIMSIMGLVDERTGMQIQNLLICIEMLLASLLHYYIFPHREWAENYKRDKQKQQTGVPDTMAFRDFVQDMRKVMSRWDHKSERAKKTPANDSSGQLPLIRDNDESAPLLASSQHSTEGLNDPALGDAGDVELGVVRFVEEEELREANSSLNTSAVSLDSEAASSIRLEASASAPNTPSPSHRTVHGAWSTPLRRPHTTGGLHRQQQQLLAKEIMQHLHRFSPGVFQDNTNNSSVNAGSTPNQPIHTVNPLIITPTTTLEQQEFEAQTSKSTEYEVV